MMMLQHSDGGFTLMRRPATGVWAGMWSLPEFSTQANAEFWLEKHYKRVASVQLLPSLKHVFSHYKLTIYPLLCILDDNALIKKNEIMEAEQRLWYKSKIFEGGVPAPVTILLENQSK